MATKPKAILSTHDGREASPITKASNVLFENGQNAQDILNDRQDAMISPVIENSSSMFKVGRGDNVDYSANVVNGAYECMVLKGNTKVNLIQESSSKDVVLPYEFADGQYVTINDTKESGALGIELKGQTLVNLQPPITKVADVLPQFSTSMVSNNIVTVTILDDSYPWNDRTMIKNKLSMRLQSNKKYFLKMHFKNNGNTTLPLMRILNSDSSEVIGSEYFTKEGYVIFTTRDVEGIENMDAYLGIHTPQNAMPIGSTFEFGKIIFTEYQEGMENWNIPYFTGMASCKMPTLHTVGKNLFDHLDNEKLCIYAGGNVKNEDHTIRYAIQQSTINVTGQLLNSCLLGYKFPLKHSESITISATGLGSTLYYRYYGEDFEVLSNQSQRTKSYVATNNVKSVTIPSSEYPSEAEYIFLGIGDTTKSDYVIDNLQIEYGKSATSYELHKSSILSLPEEVVLGGLGSARDTLNTVTGKYTKRTDTMTVTNYKNSLGSGLIKGAWSIVVTPPNKKWQSTTLCVSDKFSMGGGHSDRNCGFYENPANFVFFDKTVNSADEFIAKYGDFSFTYILENPIVTKINLSSTLKSWNTTTHIYSEIPENTLYPILSHSNPTYPVILKPSTKYSIVANSYSNNHTNSPINFNLGGATVSTTVGNRVTTITTPNTLTSEELVMSGRGNRLNNVMVIEGDVVGDEPYFEGICDCKSPILSNVGKNLYNKERSKVFSHSHVVFDGEKVSFIQSSNRFRLMIDGAFKEKTKYAIRYEVVSGRGSVLVVYDDGTWTRIDGRLVTDGNKTIDRIESEWTNGTLSVISDIQIEESSSATAYEPYKSNILSANGDKIELTEDMFEQGTLYYGQNTFEDAKKIADGDTSTKSFRIRSKKLIKVKPNTTYRFSYKNSCQSWFYGYDMNENPTNSKNTVVGATEQVFTTNANTHYLAFVLFKTGNPNITPSSYDYDSIQIREVDKTIVLRSLPNGTCDTLNVETGEYVQRISEVMLDGSEDEAWGQYTGGNGNIYYGTFAYENVASMGDFGHRITICDKLKTPTSNTPSGGNNKYSLAPMSNKGSSGFTFSLNHTETVAEAKQWLQANPITVQYLLKEPIVKKVDLSGYPFSYENGHVVLSSGSIEQSLTPKVEYSVATNRNGQIRSNQKMVEKHQKELDKLQAIILANLINSQYQQTLTTLKYELSRV